MGQTEVVESVECNGKEARHPRLIKAAALHSLLAIMYLFVGVASLSLRL